MDIIERGRIAITPGDVPDYSAPRPLGQVPVGPVYTSTDIAELAARLGSPVTFDRRGNVIWYDSFENGLHKWELDVAAGGSIISSAEAARTGGLSCKMTCPNGLGDLATINHYSGFPVLSSLGFEISSTVAPHTGLIAWQLILADGTNNIGALVVWSWADHTLTVYAATGNFVFARLVYIYPSTATRFCFHTAKLVADFVNRKYLRFILDHEIYDLSMYDLTLALMPVEAHLMTTFEIANRTLGENPIVYADDAIITQNEPPNP